jgi:hypothetical protein
MDLTTTQLLLILIAGAVGGLAYDYYYKLLTLATYLSALYHVGAGALAGGLVVFSGALGVPSDYGTFLLVAAIGYGGTDVIDSFIQKLQTTPAAAPAAT